MEGPPLEASGAPGALRARPDMYWAQMATSRVRYGSSGVRDGRFLPQRGCSAGTDGATGRREAVGAPDTRPARDSPTTAASAHAIPIHTLARPLPTLELRSSARRPQSYTRSVKPSTRRRPDPANDYPDVSARYPAPGTIWGRSVPAGVRSRGGVALG